MFKQCSISNRAFVFYSLNELPGVEILVLAWQRVQQLGCPGNAVLGPQRRVQVLVAVDVFGVVQFGGQVAPEHVDGHAEVEGYHVVEPQGRNEQNVAW